jgi:hypothetical protein
MRYAKNFSSRIIPPIQRKEGLNYDFLKIPQSNKTASSSPKIIITHSGQGKNARKMGVAKRERNTTNTSRLNKN